VLAAGVRVGGGEGIGMSGAGRFSEVPRQLRAIPRWILWRWVKRPGGKLDKLPVRIAGDNASAFDPGNQMTFEEAVDRLGVTRGAEGIAIVLGAGLGGVDLDACLGADGNLTDWAADCLKQFDTYAEISPSGTGIKLFAFGAPAYLSRNSVKFAEVQKGRKAPGIEAYVTGRFFTVTGERCTDAPSGVRSCPQAWEWMAERLRASTTPPPSAGRPPEFVIEPEQLEVMLDRIDVETFRNENVWFRLMASCHHVTNGDGREVFIAWSISDGAYSDHAEIIGRRWDSLNASRPGGIGWGPLVRALREAGAGGLVPREVMVEAKRLRFEDWEPDMEALDFSSWEPEPLDFGGNDD
jgi:hypothetical protein